ncbi:MAG: hypothetical protein RIR00_1075 [Pseudomonadota bacterium]
MALSNDIPAEAPPAAATPLDRLREAFARLSNQQKIVLGIAVAAIVALVVGSVLWSRQPDYKVLFSNIGERDGGAIITALEQLNIPYKFAEGSGTILLPADKVHEVRLRLASQGLPKGGAVGFELMENQKFGTSQFAEQVNFQRALEGELGRTIQSIAAVQQARVHLAIPKPSVFVREEQKPTASILVNLYPGRSLEPAQVAGITHLVAASVPQMPLANVSIIDQNGNLLSQLKSRMQEIGLDPTQLKYVREIETSIINRITDILSPVLGPDNVKVQVAADIDFSQTEQTAESYGPNSTPPNISVRSQQSTETASVNQNASGGIPGALTNQPPVPATAPITTPSANTAPGGNRAAAAGEPLPPGQMAAAGIQGALSSPLNAAGQPLNSRKDSTINYEVDKTVRYTKQSVGSIRRLSAAVVLNHRKETGKDGKPVVRGLPDAELKQINDLVKEAMGFSKDRGDSLSVANAPFTVVEKPDNSLPLWKDPDNVNFAKDIFKYVLIAAIIAYLLLGVVRPILKTMFPPPPPPPEAEEGAGPGEPGFGGEGGEDDAAQVEIDHFAVKVQQAQDIAQMDPKLVANIIKDWLGANG